MDMKRSVKDWIVATRPWSFPASTMPVVVTLVYLLWRQQEINWLYGVWALLDMLVFQAAGNTWSDYFDYKYKVDCEDTYGSKILTDKHFTPKEILFLAIGLISVAAAGGFILFLRTGLPLLYIGLAGLLCALFYPTLKYHALGDLAIFLCYALLPMLGTSYVSTGVLDWNTLYVAIPVGLITVAILHANNTRDIRTDSRAEIKTVSMIVGWKTSAYIYCFEVIFPFLWIVGCVIAKIYPVYALLTVIALIPALKNARQILVSPADDSKGIAALDENTAKLQLVFSLLFSLSFLIAYILS